MLTKCLFCCCCNVISRLLIASTCRYVVWVFYTTIQSDVNAKVRRSAAFSSRGLHLELAKVNNSVDLNNSAPQGQQFGNDWHSSVSVVVLFSQKRQGLPADHIPTLFNCNSTQRWRCCRCASSRRSPGRRFSSWPSAFCTHRLVFLAALSGSTLLFSALLSVVVLKIFLRSSKFIPNLTQRYKHPRRERIKLCRFRSSKHTLF